MTKLIEQQVTVISN